MKKVNLARIIWVTSLFLLLFVILLMVMDYKINYQYLVRNQLYFYECDGSNLCVTEVENRGDLLYSIYDCGYEDCPTYKKNIGDSYVLLGTAEQTILYNYRDGLVISKEYEDYVFINENYIVVTLKGYQGIINVKNEITVSPIYEQIGYQNDGYLTGYSLFSIIAKKNQKYGIISIKDGTILVDFQYEDNNLDELMSILKKEEAEIIS